jgi:putative glutamine amidotransferase
MTGKPRVGLTERSPRALRPTLHALEQAGAEPVVFPLLSPRDELRRALDGVHGVVLPGGAGMDWIWRRERRPGGRVVPGAFGWREFQETDILLARWCLEDGRPILGLCRGAQMMALAAGGELDRDVPFHDHPHFPAHDVEVDASSRLHDALGRKHLAVNSRHKRAVARLPVGSALRLSAWAAGDGVVEGLESGDSGFAVGVQFHPEDLVDVHTPSRRLFAAFVAACRERGD